MPHTPPPRYEHVRDTMARYQRMIDRAPGTPAAAFAARRLAELQETCSRPTYTAIEAVKVTLALCLALLAGACSEAQQPPPPYRVYFQVDAPADVRASTADSVADWNAKMDMIVFELATGAPPPALCGAITIGTHGDLLPHSVATTDLTDPCVMRIVLRADFYPSTIRHELGHTLLGPGHTPHGILSGDLNRTITPEDAADVRAFWNLEI